MPKHIVYPQVTFNHFVDEPDLKRLSLFFDRIYVSERALKRLMNLNLKSQHEHKTSIKYEQNVWQFLIDKGIVKTYPFLRASYKNEQQNKEANYLFKQLTSILPPQPGYDCFDTDVAGAEEISLESEQTNWQFLIDKGIDKTDPFVIAAFKNAQQNKDANDLFKQLTQILPQQPGYYSDATDVLSAEESEQVRRQALYNFFLSHDFSVRLDAISLRKLNSDEFYPGVRTSSSYLVPIEIKSNIIQFILNDIPEPDTNTPWEQIVDFRSDEDVKNKYLAVINWINKVSNSSGSLSNLKDEYEYLYHDYIKHFKLHKLKYISTTLELIVTAGAEMLLALQSGEFISSSQSLLQINLSYIKLMEEETKIPGKEVAYIYHAKNEFQK